MKYSISEAWEHLNTYNNYLEEDMEKGPTGNSGKLHYEVFFNNPEDFPTDERNNELDMNIKSAEDAITAARNLKIQDGVESIAIAHFTDAVSGAVYVKTLWDSLTNKGSDWVIDVDSSVSSDSYLDYAAEKIIDLLLENYISYDYGWDRKYLIKIMGNNGINLKKVIANTEPKIRKQIQALEDGVDDVERLEAIIINKFYKLAKSRLLNIKDRSLGR